MNVIKPETSTDILHFLSNWFKDKKKNADAAIMAMHPTKNVNPT
jgi:hypothetical protein